MQTGSTEANKVVGRNVAALRGDMSQAYLGALLAKELGKARVDPTSITRLEKGARAITVNELVGLARIFGVHPEYLLGRNPEGDGNELRALRHAKAAVDRVDTEVAAIAIAWREAHDELSEAWSTAMDSGAGAGLAVEVGLDVENETFVSDEEEAAAWASYLPAREWKHERALRRYENG